MRVSERTLHNWESGRVRIPYASYKLIRILRGYELPGQAWKGYRLIGDTFRSPENLPFHAADARWWSLTVQMAHEYRRQLKARNKAVLGAPATISAAFEPAHVANAVDDLIVSNQATPHLLPFCGLSASASWLPMINKDVPLLLLALGAKPRSLKNITCPSMMARSRVLDVNRALSSCMPVSWTVRLLAVR